MLVEVSFVGADSMYSDELSIGYNFFLVDRVECFVMEVTVSIHRFAVEVCGEGSISINLEMQQVTNIYSMRKV